MENCICKDDLIQQSYFLPVIQFQARFDNAIIFNCFNDGIRIA
jgi:hypothetical protein